MISAVPVAPFLRFFGETKCTASEAKMVLFRGSSPKKPLLFGFFLELFPEDQALHSTDRNH